MITLTPKRGDTISLLFSAKDTLGEIQTLEDCQARIQLRDRADNVLIESSSELGDDITIDTEAGTIAWVVPYEETESLSSATYYTDVELTYGSGERFSSDTIQIRIQKDITKDIV